MASSNVYGDKENNFQSCWDSFFSIRTNSSSSICCKYSWSEPSFTPSSNVPMDSVFDGRANKGKAGFIFMNYKHNKARQEIRIDLIDQPIQYYLSYFFIKLVSFRPNHDEPSFLIQREGSQSNSKVRATAIFAIAPLVDTCTFLILCKYLWEQNGWKHQARAS